MPDDYQTQYDPKDHVSLPTLLLICAPGPLLIILLIIARYGFRIG